MANISLITGAGDNLSVDKMNAAITEANKVDSKADQTDLDASIAARITLEGTVTTHNANTANPHAVTKAQVGLGNADNTSDANKPVSTAQQAALSALAATVEQKASRAEHEALAAVVTLKADATDITEAIADAGYFGARERPGDAQNLFTSTLAGSAATLAPLSIGAPVTTSRGRVWRLPGVGAAPVIIAMREDFAIYAGEVYMARWFVERLVAAGDPLGDAVSASIAWLDKDKNVLSSTVDISVGVAPGVPLNRKRTFSIDQSADIVAHSQACYARVYVTVYPSTAATDIVALFARESSGTPGPQGDPGDLTPLAEELHDEMVALAAEVEDARAEFAGALGPRLAARFYGAPAWRGGFTVAADLKWRAPEVSDLQIPGTGVYGDTPLLQMVRGHGRSVEQEIYNGAPLDSQLAITTLLEDYERLILLNEPPYYFKSPVPLALVKDCVFRSYTGGPMSPPTIVMENPAHTCWNFTSGRGNVRFEGVHKIHHLVKPAAGVPTVQIDGGKNIHFDVLVVSNAARALRLMGSADLVTIGHLITIDSDEAIVASSGITNIVIGKHTKLGSGAGSITGGQYITILDGGFGTWTPTLTAATVGDLSVSYATQEGKWERRGKTVFISGSLVCTPTYTTASGITRVGGLPFPVRAGATPPKINLAGLSAFTWPNTSTQLDLSAINGQSYMQIVGNKSGAAGANTALSAFPTGVALTLRFNGSYETDA